MPMTSAETPNHSRLKSLALGWAVANGFGFCACEVRVPRSGYRADVAAYARDGATTGGVTRTAIFECKQARSDLLKDAHAEAASRARLAELVDRRRRLEELLAIHRPELRCGEALWPEFDRWDFSGLEHDTYRRVLAELVTARRRVMAGTKFSKMSRYRCADFLYLVVEDGIFATAEVPAGWGLLVRTGDALALARPPADMGATVEQRAALRRTIGLAAVRAVTRLSGARAAVVK